MNRQPLLNKNDSANKRADTNYFAVLNQQTQECPGPAKRRIQKTMAIKTAQKLVSLYGSFFNQLMPLK